MAAPAEPIVLALDATGLACSAVVAAGATLLAQDRLATLYGQAEHLLPMIDMVMRRAGLPPSALELVGVTVGPGSFTGIRVALSAAHGIALATRARLTGVTSFEAVAAELASPVRNGGSYVLIALESRREELYVQLFDRVGVPLFEPRAMLAGLLSATLDRWIGAAPVSVAGDAAGRAASALATRDGTTTVLENSAPDAVGVLRVALRCWRADEWAGKPVPLYLRPPDVTLPSSGRGAGG
ncbi:MAG: tRNA (adenosine(37)-N6)-threonylcarbamoyltransferase complex dimerization subunit type 1 TsaB [Alphaproteobacteria bacterium]|nr:tRNA (adenosine(37)-N6)-threonylcarbamoyltransferase complex dimerization subunit type 1 TsaB [Alphaproteobacteria bacterium]